LDHGQQTATRLPGLDWRTVNVVGVLDRFPGGKRFLVLIYPKTSEVYSAVIDDRGRIVARLGTSTREDPFSASSLSGDGRFVIGSRAFDDGEVITRAELILTDPAGAWRVPVAGSGMAVNPKFAPNGYVFCYEDPRNGAVHVAELEISND
jgi:hypothetical protein